MCVQGFGPIANAPYKPSVRGCKIHTIADLPVSAKHESLEGLSQRVSELSALQQQLNQATGQAIKSCRNSADEVRKIREEVATIVQKSEKTLEESESKRAENSSSIAEIEKENEKIARELADLKNRSLKKDLYKCFVCKKQNGSATWACLNIIFKIFQGIFFKKLLKKELGYVSTSSRRERF